ncbi:MAG: Cys-tRNA(Pro) deacylase [Clostridia bacterium]|nr:Cys-tRNA(Pro) deacylase [Clostridia bacterium]
MTKTNVMRLLDKAKINYQGFEYEFDENDLSGTHAADFLSVPHRIFYKTLAVKDNKNQIFVFCLSVEDELDLKKAANVTKSKSVEMLHVSDLLKTVGYMRGACSPIGMKKKFSTFFDNKVLSEDEIYISAGARGVAIKLKTEDLLKFTCAEAKESFTASN